MLHNAKRSSISPLDRVKKIIIESMTLCLIAVLPAIAAGFLHPYRPAWNADALGGQEVTFAMVQQWQSILWVDARGENEYQKQHILGAMLLNEDDWESLLPLFLARWNPEMKVVCLL